MRKPKKTKEEKNPEAVAQFEGLDQKFTDKDGKTVKLSQVLKDGDWWEQKSSRAVKIIITHDGVKKIANRAGIKKTPIYVSKREPTDINGYHTVIECTVENGRGEAATESGEVLRGNLGPRGKNTPWAMAQKRAYDRAVFCLLEISGLLSEDQLEDSNETKRAMDNLSPEEKKEIVPELNEILAITKEDPEAKKKLIKFASTMAANLAKYKPTQVDLLRITFHNKKTECLPEF